MSKKKLQEWPLLDELACNEWMEFPWDVFHTIFYNINECKNVGFHGRSNGARALDGTSIYGRSQLSLFRTRDYSIV